jgi:indolepyruvate ferredoxin oxidoreductase beta subunit
VDLKLLLAGVGGQGVLFVTRLLGETAMASGLQFVSSEIHGMSQRGGAVVSHIKIGPYESPLVRLGSADLLLSFTRDEGYRNLGILRPGGVWVVNCPGPEAVADDVRTYLAGQGMRLHILDADRLARQSPQLANVALVGFACGRGALPLSTTLLRATLEAISPVRYRTLNLEMFQRGLEAGGNEHRT